MMKKIHSKSVKQKYFLYFTLIFIFLTACKTANSDLGDSGGLLGSSDDTTEAIQLIKDANNNLKRIKILYTENNQRFNEFKKVLENKDIEKVKQLANDLQYAINDGYVLAESAKGNITKAQELNINEKFKEYLQLKEASLDMQIRAFDFRRQSAKLFRDKFGTDDTIQLKTAQETFRQNEEKFAKFMKDAEELSKQADKLAKESMKKKNP
ncbi:MAG: hypothetical protein ACR2MD_14015 [Aridibacter sp.]|jgi:hypothetical protein